MISFKGNAGATVKRIVLCADDYALNESASSAIITLIQKQRISATSCMTNFEHWPKFGQKLLPFADNIDIGLHFNLTTGSALTDLSFLNTEKKTYPSLAKLLMLSYLKRLKPLEIEHELNAQLDRFVDILGRNPNYIDGERHVHHFPMVQDAILKVIKARLPSKTYVRSVANMQGIASDKLKALIIRYTGAFKLRRKLNALGIPYNTSFSGIYNFKKASHFASYFSGFLSSVEDLGIIYCHPGMLVADEADPIAFARYKEYVYLTSDGFVEALRQYNIQLSRFC